MCDFRYREFVKEFEFHGDGGGGVGYGSGSYGGGGSGSLSGRSYRMADDAVADLQRRFREHGASLREAFLAFDDRGDGVISAAEFEDGIRAMRIGLSRPEIDSLRRHFDRDRDGRISCEQAALCLTQLHCPAAAAECESGR